MLLKDIPTSYTMILVCPENESAVHIVAENEVQARLIVADDLGRGLLFGHRIMPIVAAARRNKPMGFI